ncbi:MAG: hypothetical protein P8171_21525 [Candidatus Thiodiazotropha sp.]
MEHDHAAREQEMHELNGAIAALDTLQQKLELRLNEARDEGAREVLDNVIALVGAYTSEYRHRKRELESATGATQ